jgi:biopolymer transport protein ExbD
MKKRFNRSKRAEMVDLDITSLLDILVILLVFLLLNYNAAELQLDLVKDLDPSESESRNFGKIAPTVQINKNQEVFLDNVLLGRVDQNALDILNAKLAELPVREPATNTASAPKKDDKKGLINLVFDKDTPYDLVDSVMMVTARVGYNRFKFIVRGNY